MELSDIYGLKWSKAAAALERNRLRLERAGGGGAVEVTMDGRIVDDSDKRRHALFVVCSLFAPSATDVILAFASAEAAQAWKGRLQAASFYHNIAAMQAPAPPPAPAVIRT